jgi:hypothetical protein
MSVHILLWFYPPQTADTLMGYLYYQFTSPLIPVHRTKLSHTEEALQAEFLCTEKREPKVKNTS